MLQPTNTAAPDLTALVTQVLGDLAFMLSDDALTDVPAGTVWMQGEIEYYGNVRGRLQCWCTRGFATRLAANLLGLDASAGAATAAAEDALREFLNVLCGQLVTHWYGRSAVFNLSIPVVRETAGAPGNAATTRHRCGLVVDGEPLVCTHALAG